VFKFLKEEKIVFTRVEQRGTIITSIVNVIDVAFIEFHDVDV